MAVAWSPTKSVIAFSWYHSPGQHQRRGVAMREILRQVDSVVGRAGLLAEGHDPIIPIAIVRRQPLAEPMANHPIADHDHGLPVGVRIVGNHVHFILILLAIMYILSSY